MSQLKTLHQREHASAVERLVVDDEDLATEDARFSEGAGLLGLVVLEASKYL